MSTFLDRLTCLAKARTIDALTATDLTVSQLRALVVIGEASAPLSVHQVATAINLSLAATGRSLDRLVRVGLIDRREDPADRRVKRVSLTPEGQHLITTKLSVHTEIIDCFIDGLPFEYADALADALRPILDADVDYFDVDIDVHLSPTPEDISTHQQKASS
ncbi:MAG: MarR family transcriptional regulator [Gordonia sp. (in: high G+C Gram-positive bacteria)]